MAAWQDFTGLNRGAREDDPGDFSFAQSGEAHGHREISFSGAGRSDSEHDVVFVDCFKVISLAG